MNIFKTTMMTLSIYLLSTSFDAYAARSVTVNGKEIQTGRAYELQELLNGVNPSSAFNNITNSGIPVFADFYAPWCGPCKMMTPRFEDLAKECDHVLFVKINTDNFRQVASSLGVQAFPTFLSFRNGQQVTRIVGGMSKSQLKQKSGVC